jgi:hypothetical protein
MRKGAQIAPSMAKLNVNQGKIRLANRAGGDLLNLVDAHGLGGLFA